MNFKNYVLVILVIIAIATFAILFRYEYIGVRDKIDIRVDRWSGCIEMLKGNQEEGRYEKYAC